MKIIKEDMGPVDQFPEAMLTDFISRGWQTIGELKSTLDGLSMYQNTEKIRDLTQSLLDAYLVYVGQLEGQVPSGSFSKPTPVVAGPTLAEPEELDQPSQAIPVEVPPEIVTAALNANPEDPTNVEQVVVTNPAAAQAFAGASDYFTDFDEPKPDATADNAIADAMDELKKQKAQEPTEDDIFNVF